jgi:hypothetical protein
MNGFGGQVYSDYIMEVQLQYLDSTSCNDTNITYWGGVPITHLNGSITPSMMCTYAYKKTPYKGDEGGPLMDPIENVQVCIISYSGGGIP